MFRNREDAGRQLALRLREYAGSNVILLAIPRGGVAVAAEVSAALNVPLDLVIPRKIGAPQNEELAIGAVAGEGELIIDKDLAARLGVSKEYLDRAVNIQLAEISRRRLLYMGDRPPPDVSGRVAIIIDDGLATGSTALAAIREVKSGNPSKLLLAIPVAPRETINRIAAEVDELICLAVPGDFSAVGQFYQEFEQVSDDEVVAIMDRLKRSA